MSAGDALVESLANAMAKLLEPMIAGAVQRALSEAELGSAGPQLLRLEQAAERLGCSVRQIQKHVARGRLKTVRLNGGGSGRPMIRLDELERFIESSER